MLLPCARRSVHASLYPLKTSAWPLAHYRAPVPTDPTSQENLKQRDPGLLFLTVPESTLHEPRERSPTLHSRPGALIHIRGLFPTLRIGVLPLFPAPLAATSFYRQVSLHYPGSILLRYQAHH